MHLLLTLGQRRSELGVGCTKGSIEASLISPYGVELGRSQIAGHRLEVSNNVPSNLTKGSGTDLSAVI